MGDLNLWTEKYRPHNFNALKGQNEINSLLTNSVKTNNHIHYIFYGPPGTGKTSSALIYCNSIYPETKISEYVLEINASYEHSIDVIQNKIKPFCQKSITPFTNSQEQLINYKIIILDEADTLTQDTQNALRRYIEIYSHNTRFIFLCNYISKIISPIISRCASFHFTPVSRDESILYMKNICTKEQFQSSSEVIEEILAIIYKYNEGDLRSCTSSLQAIYMMYSHQLTVQNTLNYFLTFPSDFFDDIQHSKLSFPSYVDSYLVKKTNETLKRTVHFKNFVCFCIEYISNRYIFSDKILIFFQRLSTLEKYSIYEKDIYSVIIQLISYIIDITKTESQRSI